MSSMNSSGETTTPRDSEDLYKELTSFFQAHAGKVLEVEVLPTGFPLPPEATSSILQDDTKLGITKKSLALAFLTARHIFFSILKPDGCKAQGSEEANLATQVILLFDPEHITAANYRKRRLLQLGSASGTGTPINAINHEMIFLESLLTSPLHRHTKSPTLWHHRRWLMAQYFHQCWELHCSHREDRHCLKETFKQFWMSELRIIMRSGERHPKNYYAWTYARWALGFLAEKGVIGTSEKSIRYLAVCSAQTVLDWCFAHPADISGWAFLFFLLRHAERDAELRKSVIQRTFDFICKFAWTGEALWWFVRAVLPMEDIDLTDERQQYIQSILEKSASERRTGRLPS